MFRSFKEWMALTHRPVLCQKPSWFQLQSAKRSEKRSNSSMASLVIYGLWPAICVSTGITMVNLFGNNNDDQSSTAEDISSTICLLNWSLPTMWIRQKSVVGIYATPCSTRGTSNRTNRVGHSTQQQLRQRWTKSTYGRAALDPVGSLQLLLPLEWLSHMYVVSIMVMPAWKLILARSVVISIDATRWMSSRQFAVLGQNVLKFSSDRTANPNRY